MLKLLVFGEYLLYRYGGAEKSTYLLINNLSKSDKIEINVILGDKSHLNKKIDKYLYKNVVKIKFLHIRYFQFFQHFLNSIFVKRYFKQCTHSILFANNMAAPMAINSFSGPSVYFIHDEFSLNIYRCYEKKLKKRIKFIVRFLIDFPFILYYRAQNKKSMNKAKLLVANSQYVANKIEKIFRRKAMVMYEQVDVVSLSQIELPPLASRPYIMMVGDAETKGISIFKKIAKSLPEYKFLLVGKSYSSRSEANLFYHGFVRDPIELFMQSKIVVMPSVWEEALGMVSIEASALGIPAIVSSQGGLPETVPSSEYVIRDYYNIQKWVDKIHWIMSDYKKHSLKARNYSHKFDMRRQVEAFRKEVYKVTGLTIN